MGQGWLTGWPKQSRKASSQDGAFLYVKQGLVSAITTLPGLQQNCHKTVVISSPRAARLKPSMGTVPIATFYFP